MFSKIFRRTPTAQHSHPSSVATINVLCRIWMEDGVWNGSAVDLPVAVHGKTIEHAKRHLIDAVIGHLEALQEVGLLEQEMERLQRLAQDCRLSVDDMPEGLLCKTTAKVSDHRVAAVMCP